MKDKFHGHYTPTKDEFASLWESSLVVLDTNVLLNLYTYSETTCDELLELLGRMESRIWLPNQVAAEYRNTRPSNIRKAAKSYDDLAKNLEAMFNLFKDPKTLPFIEGDLLRDFEDVVNRVKGVLKKCKNSRNLLMQQDSIQARINELFSGKVGDAYSASRLREIYREGEDRYACEIPPGYCDINKKPHLLYGDLVIWFQIIEHAATERRPIIFVTDDEKVDWWNKEDSRVTVPRPELIEEFRSRTGESIYFYSSQSFIESAKCHGQSISSKAVAEVEEATKRRRVEAEMQTAEMVQSFLETQKLLSTGTPDSLNLAGGWNKDLVAALGRPSPFGRQLYEDIVEASRRAFEAQKRVAAIMEPMTRDLVDAQAAMWRSIADAKIAGPPKTDDEESPDADTDPEDPDPTEEK